MLATSNHIKFSNSFELRKKSHIGVAVLNNKLYAVGGSNGDTPLDTVECYDPQTNKWTSCAPVPKQRFAPGVGVAHEYLYVVEGRVAYEASNSVERLRLPVTYDPKTDTWCSVAPMSTERCGVGVGVLDNRLFAVGGHTGFSVDSSVVEVYDPVLKEWQKLPPLEMSGRCTSCVVIDNSTFKLV